MTLAKFYGVSTDSLLGMTENRNHPNADLADLRLSDEMIGLLRGGKIKARLLCEMAAHPDFVKLLDDIEIFVDSIAAMQIQNLNAWVDVARAEIREKYQPGEQDKTMYLLNAAHLQEGEYFSQRVRDDMDAILRDLREAHRGDSTSAQEAGFGGSGELQGEPDKLIMLFCTDEAEIQPLDRLTRNAQKSELAKGPIPQRGKKH